MPHDKAVPKKPPLYCVNRSDDPGIVGWEEASGWQQQQTAVKPFGAVRLHEAPQLRIISFFAYVSMDLLSNLPPMLHRSIQAELRCNLGTAVKSDPCHHLAEGEMPGRPAAPPDA